MGTRIGDLCANALHIGRIRVKVLSLMKSGIYITKMHRLPKSSKLHALLLSLVLALALFLILSEHPFAQETAKSNRINPAIAEYEPALAVRTPTCIACHAKIRSSVITDFGYGDRYFFGNRAGGGKFGTFDGHIYGDFFGGAPNKTGWATAEISKNVIVPRAAFDFDIVAEGSKLPDEYRQALQARSLAQYLRELERQKQTPAAVIEKKSVFIGAADGETLEARFGIAPGSEGKTRYIKTDESSPELSGIGFGSGSAFFTNTGDVACDGDLLVRGTLFLKQPVIATETGCRIYATGPVFLQGGITYKNPNGSADRANLQLVSSKAILLGLGDRSCDSTYKDSPLSRRLVSGLAVSTYMTRDAARLSLTPPKWGEAVYAEGKRIPELEDAGCREDNLDFTRLLLNAPQVHSRYKGNFKGLIIAELVLFRLGKSNFEFDPVFKRVPVLPRLKDSDYLVVR
jgi:hypothetical protein